MKNGMYMIINWVYNQNHGHQDEAHHPSHRIRRLFIDLHLMGLWGCANAIEVTKLQASCSSPNPLRNQFIHSYICRRGVLGTKMWFSDICTSIRNPLSQVGYELVHNQCCLYLCRYDINAVDFMTKNVYLLCLLCLQMILQLLHHKDKKSLW